MRLLKGAFTKTKKGGSTQLYGLKSHDWHKILQFVLPITISGYGDTKVKASIFKVGEIVRFVSSKEIEVEAIPIAHQLAIKVTTGGKHGRRLGGARGICDACARVSLSIPFGPKADISAPAR
ncbi:hypothetical protein GOP47_0000327 [Adiantum capillus-veneris]|uniref:Uncharacterized protein n=1 Tax=Adiantum capillus-veneris TaxID=13818 RepID=A0A9D4ZQL8_ADICA|nr:hypothetical protein GOP47_0000327 [Adiantum capillus-veneris]